jgi:two-component system, OmpR family, alkaline phosphatase synthesis response regulator PhoP
MPHKIFIVEDNEMYSFFLQYSLGTDQLFRISSFTSGQEFLRAVKSESPDILIIDHLLPDASGDELLKQAKPYLKSTRVIVLTASREENLGNIYRELKVDSFLHKEKEVIPKLRARL